MPDLVLEGCRPTPLASYLKALGILRLVAEQADPTARGWWHEDRFHLRTTLDRDKLMRFFLEEYRPTPIIAPWNGGSGFYPNDATAGIDAIRRSTNDRYTSYRDAIELATKLIRERGLHGQPTDEAKGELIADLRVACQPELIAWIDTAVALTLSRTANSTASRAAYPPLLGSGGNDGRLEFTNNFMQRLTELISADNGKPLEPARDALDNALFAVPVTGLSSASIGQFGPGTVGGVNMAAGLEGKARVNSWDFVLMLEGAIVFAGGVSRRLESTDRSHPSYPFAVEGVAAGFGSACLDEQAATRGELWAPLWNRPSGLREVRSLFREGRLSLGTRTARDGLDAARAVAGLGADRRLVAFERYAFVRRFGNNHLATPLGRRFVEPNPMGELLSDLDRDRDRWLHTLRTKAASDDASAGFSGAVRALEDAIFAVLEKRQPARETQDLLIGLGQAVRCVAQRPALQFGSKKSRTPLPPPPRLSELWIAAADDSSPEFRLALALAGLRMARGMGHGDIASETTAADVESGEHTDDDEPAAGDSDSTEPPGGDAQDRVSRYIVDLAMCAHLGPLDPDSLLRNPRWAGKEKRAGEGRVLAVWGEGGLVDNLCSVAQRRLIEQRRRGMAQVPFDGVYGADSGDIRAFLDGEVDDARIADLLVGLAWVWPKRPESKSGRVPLPFAYAALKPLFTPRHVLEWLNREHRLAYEVRDLPVPPALPSLLVAGRVAEAVRLGQQRAQASGLPAPFLDPRSRTDRRPPDVAFGRRLLAALVVPVASGVVEDCLIRAYPPDVRGQIDSLEEDADNAA